MTGMRVRDVLRESFAALASRPVRTLLAMAGTAIGTGALVAIVGISDIAQGQITDRLGELQATQLTVEARTPQPGTTPPVLTADGVERSRALNGTVAAATRSVLGDQAVAFLPPRLARPGDARTMTVVATSADMVAVAGGHMSSGRFFDHGSDRRADPVAVLGRAAATRLGIADVRDTPAVFIDGQPIIIVGVLAAAPDDPELLPALIVPHGFARARFGVDAPDRLEVRTVPGAARMIASQLPAAIAPNDPTAWRVNVTPGTPDVGRAIEEDLGAMAFVLAATALVAGALGIANLSLVGVMERTAEIGLRRTLGTHRRHIALQFLAESAGIGLLGGMWGATGGIVALVAVSAWQGWGPVLSPWAPAGALTAGTLVGVLAGAYPATQAARIEPAEAVRR